jgi:hypothetical protein
MAKRPAARHQQAQRSVTYTILFLGTLALAAVGVIVAILGFFGLGNATQFTASGADKLGGIQTTSVGLAITFLSFLAMVVMAINKPHDVQPFAVAPKKSGSQQLVDRISENPLPLIVVTVVVVVLLVIRLLVH